MQVPSMNNAELSHRMDAKDLVGSGSMFGGSLTACGSGLGYLSNESIMLIIFSGLGALISVGGLIYTIWNSNRNYRLAREQLELQRKEFHHGDHSRTELRS